MAIYGYCRVSTSRQSIEHQERNIIVAYPNAKIMKETYTGTKVVGREVFNKILKNIKKDDILVFDSVSRMSRNAEEGFQLYKGLFNKGVELVFLKEPHINTETYKLALTNGLELTGTNIDYLIEGINKYLLALAEEQIKLAFEQSEKEVKDLQQRTKEGIETARRKGKQIGIVKGQKLTTKKSLEAKEKIRKYSRDFQGMLQDKEVIELCKISRNSYYKYKKELMNETSKIEDLNNE